MVDLIRPTNKTLAGIAARVLFVLAQIIGANRAITSKPLEGINMKLWQISPPNRLFLRFYGRGLGRLLGKLILLLTTTGRKSGKRHTIPLQYEEVAGVYYVGAAMGMKADWVCNILANPQVEVAVKSRHFRAMAEVVTDSGRIADFLELRLRRHPLMVGRILAMAGLSAQPNRRQLEAYATQLALVIIRPEGA